MGRLAVLGQTTERCFGFDGDGDFATLAFGECARVDPQTLGRRLLRADPLPEGPVLVGRHVFRALAAIASACSAMSGRPTLRYAAAARSWKDSIPAPLAARSNPASHSARSSSVVISVSFFIGRLRSGHPNRYSYMIAGRGCNRKGYVHG